MKYIGKLYGRQGKIYFPLIATSEDVDKMEAELLTTRAEVERLSSNFNWLRKLDMSLCPEPNGEWSVLDSKNERAYFGKTPEMAIEEARQALEKGKLDKNPV